MGLFDKAKDAISDRQDDIKNQASQHSDQVEQGIDKAKNLVNDKAGKDVVNDEHTSKAEEVVNENVQKITDKFGK